MAIQGMGPTYLNGMRAVGVNPGVWLTMDPEEFAAQLRGSGWGEKAIAGELATLASYIAQFAVPKPTKPAIEVPQEKVAESRGLRAILDRRTKMRNLKEELGVDDDGD